MAPVTFSASLVATAIGLGVIAWDLNDFGRDAQDIIVMSDRATTLRRRITTIADELTEINDVLNSRFDER